MAAAHVEPGVLDVTEHQADAVARLPMSLRHARPVISGPARASCLSRLGVL